jgi:hypothetical protein
MGAPGRRAAGRPGGRAAGERVFAPSPLLSAVTQPGGQSSDLFSSLAAHFLGSQLLE